jgi:hypothetical protein
MTLNPEEHFRSTAPMYMRLLLADFPQLAVEDAAAVFGNAGDEKPWPHRRPGGYANGPWFPRRG